MASRASATETAGLRYEEHRCLRRSLSFAEGLSKAAEAIGPILLGTKKPVHILQLGSSVREIVNMVTIAVLDAQARK